MCLMDVLGRIAMDCLQCFGGGSYADRKIGTWRTIMKNYRMDTSETGVLGEGTFCICRRGRALVTGKDVAVRTYKAGVNDMTLTLFKQLVAVLQELHRPFERPVDPKLWAKALEGVQPEDLFMRLIDYSTDAVGQPGPSAVKGEIFAITEIAQHGLKDYIDRKRMHSMPPSKETVRDIAVSIVRVVAGLHAKGFVHLDLKPENFMFFDGRLKLIDVDGCVKLGTDIFRDSVVNFDPCYCAPEWACFLSEGEPSIVATPGLDSWSVGCTLCELVTLEAMMKPAFTKCLTSGPDKRRGSLLFMEWLGQLEKAPVPRKVERFDTELLQLIRQCLLVCDQDERRTCAESLADPYMALDRILKTKSSPIQIA